MSRQWSWGRELALALIVGLWAFATVVAWCCYVFLVATRR